LSLQAGGLAWYQLTLNFLISFQDTAAWSARFKLRAGGVRELHCGSSLGSLIS